MNRDDDRWNQTPPETDRREDGTTPPAPPHGQPAYRNPAQPYGQAPYPRSGSKWAQPLYTPPQEASPEAQAETSRHFLRKTGGRVSFLPILVTLLQFACVFVFLVVWMAANISKFLPDLKQGNAGALTRYLMSRTDTILLLTYSSAAIAMVLSVIIARSMLRGNIGRLWAKPKWTAGGFAKWVVLLFGAAGAGELCTAALQALSRLTGVKISSPDFSLTGHGVSDAVMLAYVCILGPIMEELLFRGLILQSLRPWGGRLAVVVSAVLFGLTHMNLIQGIPTVLIGLLLGAVAVRTGSVIPGIALHILFNSTNMALMVGGVNSNSALAAGYVVFLAVAALGSVFLLVSHRTGLPADAQPAPGVFQPEHPYRTVFLRSPSFWVTVACFALFSFLLASPLASGQF